jgi:hypothetical protein
MNCKLVVFVKIKQVKQPGKQGCYQKPADIIVKRDMAVLPGPEPKLHSYRFQYIIKYNRKNGCIK